MPTSVSDPSPAMVISQTANIYRRENFEHANETAECPSHVTVNVESISVAGEKKTSAGDERKYHSMVNVLG